MRPINLISIDLDWFNCYEYCGLKDRIRTFFYLLSKHCRLSTDRVTVLTDHHYMYPWSWEVMRKHGASEVNIVNVDMHHDFYFLDSVSFSDKCVTQITCGNFLAFMAHEGILRSYDWITSVSGSSVSGEMLDFYKSISEASCDKVKEMEFKTRFFSCHEVWEPIVNRVFDGLVVVKSPDFTSRYKSVMSATEESLSRFFPNHQVKHSTCKRNFPYNSRRIRMKKLVA